MKHCCGRPDGLRRLPVNDTPGRDCLAGLEPCQPLTTPERILRPAPGRTHAGRPDAGGSANQQNRTTGAKQPHVCPLWIVETLPGPPGHPDFRGFARLGAECATQGVGTVDTRCGNGGHAEGPTRPGVSTTPTPRVDRSHTPCRPFRNGVSTTRRPGVLTKLGPASAAHESFRPADPRKRFCKQRPPFPPRTTHAGAGTTRSGS